MNTIETSNFKKTKAYVGSGLIRKAGELISGRFPRCTAMIITDDITGSRYLPELEANLEHCGFKTERIILPSGDLAKNFSTLDMILNRFAEFGVTRHDLIVALGGGAICDIAGFAASVYMRGIALVNMPTTLFSAVSSAVNGENAMNIRAGKNLAGTSYQPDIIIADYSAFETVSQYNMGGGYAEILKLSIIQGGGLLDILKNGSINDNLEEIISSCIRLKMQYQGVCGVTRDVNPLDFGDILTSAICKCSNYSIARGQAMPAALMITAEGAFRTGICSNECRDIISEILNKLDVEYSCDYSSGRLWYAALSDYPTGVSDKIPMVIPVAPGNCEIMHITPDELFNIVSLGRAALGEEQ